MSCGVLLWYFGVKCVVVVFRCAMWGIVVFRCATGDVVYGV